MSMRKILIPALVAVSALGAIAIPTASEAKNKGGYAVRVPPPPMHHEYLPAPRYGFVWVPGYWDWRGRSYAWINGHWLRERPGYIYHPHYWEPRHNSWYANPGRWERHPSWAPPHRERHHGRSHDRPHDRRR